MKRKDKPSDEAEKKEGTGRKSKRAAKEDPEKQEEEKIPSEKKAKKETKSASGKALLKPDTLFDSITDATTDFPPLFDALAEEVINNHVLMVCGTALRFREIEFYVNHPNHPDKYTHSDVDQKRAGCWYFHKIGKSYRGGTYKGLDISIGGKNHFGGILTRSLFDKGSGEIIEGSCLCVDYIIKLVKKKYPSIEEIKDIVSHSNYNEKVLDKSGMIHIEKADKSTEKYKYYKGPRVGLGQKYPEYLNKLYRYVVLPAKVKKGKDTLVKALVDQGISKREVQSLTGSTLGFIDKALENKTK